MESAGVQWSPVESTGVWWSPVESAGQVHWTLSRRIPRIPVDSPQTGHANLAHVTLTKSGTWVRRNPADHVGECTVLLLCHCPQGTCPITLPLKDPLRSTQTISLCDNLPMKWDHHGTITENYSSWDAGEPNQHRQDTDVMKAGYPIPDSRDFVLNKLRAKPLYLLKM